MSAWKYIILNNLAIGEHKPLAIRHKEVSLLKLPVNTELFIGTDKPLSEWDGLDVFACFLWLGFSIPCLGICFLLPLALTLEILRLILIAS